MTKKLLRKKVIEVLCSIPCSVREQKSTEIASHLFLSDMWRNADTLFLFLSFDTEVVTDMIVEQGLLDNKVVAVPCINRGIMTFHRINGLDDSLTLNDYGIREPCKDRPVISIHDTHNALVITPGLAFDRDMNRLGRGGGYYDRFIAQIRSHTKNKVLCAGICFSEQLVSGIPVNSHDMKVDTIVTDLGIIR